MTVELAPQGVSEQPDKAHVGIRFQLERRATHPSRIPLPAPDVAHKRYITCSYSRKYVASKSVCFCVVEEGRKSQISYSSMFSGGQGAASGKPNATTSAPGANQASTTSTPPSSTVTQQPPIQQQQQHPPYTYAPPHPTTYSLPFQFAMVHPHHPQHPHPPQHQVGGGNGGVGNGGGGPAGGAPDGPPSLIDPMLSAMSDGGEGMSDDEGGERNRGSAGVKNGPPSSGGNNGINHHALEDDEYPGDDGDQSMTGGGGHPSGGEMQMRPQSPPVLDENGQPVKKKRRRQALSCTECKRRKIKCDRQNPCSPCNRRGEGERCRWVTQEPIEKFVTRGEYDLLHAKVMHLEAMIAAMTGRAFMGGMDPMNLPLGPPPFGFVAPPGAQHHPYPGPPGQQPQPGGSQETHYHHPGGEQPPPHTTPELQAFHHYVQAAAMAAANQHQQPAPPVPILKPVDASMEVDSPHGVDRSDASPDASQSQGNPATTAPTATLPVAHAEATKAVAGTPKATKGRKRKDRAEADGDAGDEASATPSGGRAAKMKPRSRGVKAGNAAAQPGWDTSATMGGGQEQGASAEPNAGDGVGA